MCGIFGAISNGVTHQGEFYHFMSQLMEQSQIRGRDATGFASIADSKFITDKHPVAAYDFSRLNKEWRKIMSAKQVSMIGHTRAATNGNPARNYNNHPFHGPRYTIAHNGCIWGHETIAREQGFHLRTECDSEVILHFLEKHKEIQDGIVDALAELDSVSMMAVCTLERDTGNIHLFRNNESPCSVFHFPRWNATVFASTPNIIARAACHTLGSMGNVWQSAEMVFNNKGGDIPAYSHITITSDGEVKVEDIDEQISKVAGHSHRGRIKVYGYGGPDVSVVSGGKSKWEMEREKAQSPAKSNLDNTAVMTTCPDCRVYIVEPNPGERVTCECGCIISSPSSSVLTNTAAPLRRRITSSGEPNDVFLVLPYEAHELAESDVLEWLNAIRELDSSDSKWELSDYSLNEYISIDMLDYDAKLNKWCDVDTEGDILAMGEGEYIGYYSFVEELISGQAK